MNKRRRQMAKWAAENLPLWPAHESLAEADPAEIGCEFVHLPQHGSLPALRCMMGGGLFTSTDYFYLKRGIK